MLRGQLMNAELYYEFKKLSRGMEMSLRSSLKIGLFFMKKAKRFIAGGFWFFLESPKLWERIGPDKGKRLESMGEYQPYLHPPSGLHLH